MQKEIANDLGVGHSTLGKWILLTRQQKLESPQDNELPRMTTDKKPQDWSAKEKLKIVIACASLNEEKTNELCRERGIFSHHITQWKLDFIMPPTVKAKADKQSDIKALHKENKALKKELNRKDKALTETAALISAPKKSQRDLGHQRGRLTMSVEFFPKTAKRWLDHRALF